MDVLEKIAKACSDVFALWNLDLNFFLLLDGFFKSFHAQADLAIFDTDDFDLNFSKKKRKKSVKKKLQTSK